MITLVFRTQQLGFLPELRLPPSFSPNIIKQAISRFSYSQNIRHGAGPHAIGTSSRRNISAALATAMAQFVSGLKSDRRCAARMHQRMQVTELGTDGVGSASLIAALDANYDKLF